MEDLLVEARILSALGLVAGLTIAYSLRHVQRKISIAIGPSGLGVGASIIWISVMGLLFSYSLLPPYGFTVGVIVGGISFATSAYYLAGRKHVMFWLLGPFLIQAANMTFPIQSSSLYFYAGASLAFFSALAYSRVSMADCMTKTDRYLGGLLWPFLVIEKTVGRAFRGSSIRLTLGACYLLFGLAVLVALPLLIADWTGGVLGFEYLVLGLMILWFASMSEWRRALDRLKN